jgi:hypothetical protein
MSSFVRRRAWLLVRAPVAALLAVVTIAMFVAPCSAAPRLARVPVPAASPLEWLCRPGLSPDPCQWDRAATVVEASGAKSEVAGQTSASVSRFDCFFVYPTASTEHALNANLAVQPVEDNAAYAIASRFSQLCQVYAPIYRQVTWQGIYEWASDPKVGAAAGLVAFQSILAGFEDYLAHFNRGRPIILIGASQGSSMLILIMQHLVDDNPALRRRLALAILTGGNVEVRTGALVGGSFSHIPVCSKPGQAGCVIAYSSFPDVPLPGSRFGRPGKGVSVLSDQTATKGLQVACVNPAAIGGGSARLDSFFPVLQKTAVVSVSIGKVSTNWVEYPGLYRASCQSGNGATWLQVAKATGPSDHRPLVTEVLGPNWGYHVDDTNLALGNLVVDAAAAEATWEKSTK